MRGLQPVLGDGLGNCGGRERLGFGQNAAGLGLLLGGIEITIGGQFDGAALALGLGHLRAAGALGIQLLQHRGAGGVIQIHVQNLGPRHLDPPIIDHIGQRFADPADQRGAVRLNLIQLHRADFRTHDPGDGGGDGGIDIADAIDGLFRFDDAIEHTGFDLDQHVVGGDGILAVSRQLPFQNRDPMRHAVKERDDEIDPRPKNGAQAAEPFNHEFL